MKGATKEPVAYANIKNNNKQNSEIESIELNINDNLISYLSNGGEQNPDGTGGGSPSYFVTRRKLMINPMNIKICI